MSGAVRFAFVAIALLLLGAALYFPPVDWKSAWVAIVGGLGGAVWGYFQYLDQTRADKSAPPRTFTLLFFAIFSFASLALSEVVQVLVANTP